MVAPALILPRRGLVLPDLARFALVGVRRALLSRPAAAVAAGGVTYATWNPADKSSAITLSNGDLTATPTAGSSSFYALRATVGKSSGKWYWELTGGAVSSGADARGVGTTGQTLAPDGGLTNLEGVRVYYSGDGNKYQPSAAYGAFYLNTDVIGLALDMGAGTLVCYKNNSSQGTLVSGLSGTFFPYIAINTSGTSPARSVIANFGASAHVYTAPAGFNQGLWV